jgi:hypothetical protein
MFCNRSIYTLLYFICGNRSSTYTHFRKYRLNGDSYFSISNRYYLLGRTGHLSSKGACLRKMCLPKFPYASAYHFLTLFVILQHFNYPKTRAAPKCAFVILSGCFF